MIDNTTICAIATPAGSGPVACVRMSGVDALKIMKALLLSRSGNMPMFEPRKLYKCTIGNAEEVLDEVLAVYYKAPQSYTGEDSVEIFCHGSTYIQQRLLELMIDNGAQPAGPGEFTQRAFLNGQLDLSQSEAVAEIIGGISASQHRLAINQLRGGVSHMIAGLRQQLLHFISLIELELDFSDEDVEFADREVLQSLISEILNTISSLIAGFRYGNAIRKGVGVAIVGRPNTGKSSLLNLLLNDDKAIVSEIPGTTRDVIEDSVVIEGILFRFIDTAGIRSTENEIELMGIARTRDRIARADIVLPLAETSDSDSDITALLDEVCTLMNMQEQQVIPVLNKADIYAPREYQIFLNPLPVSVKTGYNISLLKQRLVEAVQQMKPGSMDVVIANVRHVAALQQAQEALFRAQDALMQGLPGDLLAQDVREAVHYLGAITGAIGSDEVLGSIFKNFCIGK